LAGGGVDIVDAKVYMIMVKLLLIIVHSQYVHASGKQVVCYINWTVLWIHETPNCRAMWATFEQHIFCLVCNVNICVLISFRKIFLDQEMEMKWVQRKITRIFIYHTGIIMGINPFMNVPDVRVCITCFSLWLFSETNLWLYTLWLLCLCT